MAYYSRPQFGEGSLGHPTPIHKYDHIHFPVQRKRPQRKMMEDSMQSDSDGESHSLVRRKSMKPKKTKVDSDNDGESEPKKKKEKDSSSEEADTDDEIEILPTCVGRLLRDVDMRNILKRKRRTDGFETKRDKRNIKLFLKVLADELKDLKQIVNSWEIDAKLERLLVKVDKYKEDGFSSTLAYQEAVNRLRPMIVELIKDELSNDDLSHRENDDDDEEEIQDEQKNTDEEEVEEEEFQNEQHNTEEENI